MEIGERIKRRRLELGLSQEELAIKCGYKSRSSINKFELARDIPLRKLTTIASALNISPAELIGEDEAKQDAEVIMDLLDAAKDKYYLDLYKKLPEDSKDKVKSYISFLSQSES